MARGVGGGAIIWGRRLFKIFVSKGCDLREAINWEMAIIRGNTVVETLCPKGLSEILPTSKGIRKFFLPLPSPPCNVVLLFKLIRRNQQTR